MKISIFGLGYVGCISLGCLSKNGHSVIGIDTNTDKVELINQGKTTVIEKDIDKIINDGFIRERVKATIDCNEAVAKSDIAIICVGTPSTTTGHLNMHYINDVALQIGNALKNKNDFFTVIIRSTVPPGTNENVSNIIEKTSNKTKNKDFAVVSNPEFLREGTAVYDYYNPPYTIIGTDSEVAKNIIRKLYKDINAPFITLNIKEAEILKYVNNSFHALKVSFANEVGNICKKLEIDSHNVMEVFCKDEKLNISPYYLKPGFAYGGSCLPKDLKALTTFAHDFYIESPVLNSIDKSNINQINIALDLIMQTKKKRIGFFGLSFKSGTDDLRYSPIIEVIQNLLGKGFEISIFDKNVHLSNLIGENKSYIETKLPHINNLMTDKISNVIDFSEVLVLVNNEDEFKKLPKTNKPIIDLTRIKDLEDNNNYSGICW